MASTTALQKTVLILFIVIWFIFSIKVCISIAEVFHNGSPTYEDSQFRPDNAPFGDLTRGGHITVPNHVPPRPEVTGKTKELCTGPIDVVFTWVNGSDPEQQENLRKYHGDPQRLTIMYRDYGTLRFAMRSIEKFAPWIRHIFLLTNGQKPDWFDLEATKFAAEQFIVIVM